MLKTLIIVQLLVLSVLQPEEIYSQTQDSDNRIIYQKCGLAELLSFNVFNIAMTGLQNIKEFQNKKIIIIIDYSKPSTQERFFVIDLVNNKILYKSLVAHGKNSGENLAVSFSNDPESLKSCLGFFLTAESYNGKNDYSLSLDGLEPGINDNARKRSIVIHGADYVSTEFAKKYGRLGRSWGCPALPLNVTKEIIDRIKKGNCLFIYADDPDYLRTSEI